MPRHPVRVVTAASLFDGHDASINIIRRILQEQGAEVIHLGHNRSVSDVVKAVLQEGAQGVCVSSYQGGHMEYFKYVHDLLHACGAGYVRIWGGGGGVIIHEEKRELENYGIAHIFHPDDGRRLGLEGMIRLIVEGCDFDPLAAARATSPLASQPSPREALHNPFVGDPVPSQLLGVALTALDNGSEDLNLATWNLESFARKGKTPPVLGITGTGGAGKSSLIDELCQRFLNVFPNLRVAVVCVDPSKRRTGGSLLGDRIRINSLSRPRIFMRSVASRGSGREIASSLPRLLQFLKQTDFDLIIAETSGIGQGNTAVTEVADLSLYVMTSDFGSQSQLEKIDMIDFADFIAVNKADRRGALDAIRDVSKQYKRSRKIFDDRAEVPVFLTQASQFNDGGVNRLFFQLANTLNEKFQGFAVAPEVRTSLLAAEETVILPPERQNYLAEITACVHRYKERTEQVAHSLSKVGALLSVAPELNMEAQRLQELEARWSAEATKEEMAQLKGWEAMQRRYGSDDLVFRVRDQEIRQPLVRESLSGTKIRRVVLPKYRDWGDRFRWLRLENVPGEFPYTAGVFPLRRSDEDPKRMFAGEGPPERTNTRFHYLCQNESSRRLSTAFDSVTLYGHDPDPRPDIFGKVGESGVSVCSLDDMKRLYEGFDLCSPNTSVSMTINGPAPMILAFFFNTAIDQQVAKKQKELGRELGENEWRQVADEALQQVRGTVQADILKEDQGQNTCIFSIGFALKMMGDIQEYFIRKKVRNFYSVSISGYHIAEAGANPISQLAFTLSNGFTFIEYYLARGMNIDDFAPNFSFFFSNGLDPEYAVLGRVARRIWAVAVRDLYKGNERSQKLKYHIQTSGRSLHAQEIDFNDIRTTLQALLALYDNCNSLHTNAYDEAITTPTEESVRRAMAIQMILNREFGAMKNENPNQGSFFIEELTDLVEEAVLAEFQRLSERGGVLGAMETQYQRSRIQEESLYYERLKHSGELPIIGVNTFIDPKTLDEGYQPVRIEMARASYEEKNLQLNRVRSYQAEHHMAAEKALHQLQQTALSGGNIFESLMIAARHCSLYQMTRALAEIGGEYRRNL